MATIITREVGATAKGSPLNNEEIDNNFINLNTEVEAATEWINQSANNLTTGFEQHFMLMGA